jgi:hypothetical protein
MRGISVENGRSGGYGEIFKLSRENYIKKTRSSP